MRHSTVSQRQSARTSTQAWERLFAPVVASATQEPVDDPAQTPAAYTTDRARRLFEKWRARAQATFCTDRVR